MSLAQIIQQHVDLLPSYQQAEVLDFILFLEQKKQHHLKLLNDDERRQKLAISLQQLAQSATFSEIKDPVAWQKEVREDKPLFGRD